MKWSELTTEERNRLIATKVMGANPICTGKLEYIISDRSLGESNCYRCQECGAKLPRFSAEHARKAPSYSTDMNAAWQIMEHLTKPPETLAVAFEMRATQFMLWWEKANLWTMSASEAADAICLESLRICGVDIEP